MADNDGEGAVKVDLLHPEILSAETLVAILKERKIYESDLDVYDKYKLVELYYEHVMPLPQRIYGDGRRERRLAKLRDSRELLKRKRESGNDNEDRQSKKMWQTESNSPKTIDRLKAPPTNKYGDVTIKLTNGGKSQNDSHRNDLSKEGKASSKNNCPMKKRKFEPISWP